MLRRLANFLYHRPRNALWRLRQRALRPRLEVDGARETVRLGTPYGGWDFVDAPELRGATIVSCGLGEDASFDVAFAARYGGRVVVVDPTPRAVAHFGEIAARLGKPPEAAFVPGGRQPAAAYDLARVAPGSLVLVAKALWTERARLKFYAPPDPAHVSHSLVNFQRGHAAAGEHIEVEAVPLDAVLAECGAGEPPLLKLDIEGAEIRVIPDLLDKGIRPRQLLVDFDELHRPSRRAKAGVEAVDRRLRAAGYRLAAFDGVSDCLYVLAP